MSRFRWSSLYSPTNKSKLAFKFWHPRVHDYWTILCSRPSCVSRNTNKLLQQFLCTSAKNFMLIIGSAPVNFFYFIFLLKTKESASLAWLFLHTGRWPACIESVFYWICGSQIFSLETLFIVTARYGLRLGSTKRVSIELARGIDEDNCKTTSYGDAILKQTLQTFSLVVSSCQTDDMQHWLGSGTMRCCSTLHALLLLDSRC